VRLPGGVGISHLRVYDTEGPDGLRGGTPHVHTVCREAYAVAAGRGAVQTLTSAGFAETPLAPGVVATFGPGTVHRLVNAGGLELFVVMANAGLPEAGDLVITFPPEVLDDDDAYEAAAAVDDDGDARRRRDLGVEGFLRLRDGGAPALAAFRSRAVALVAGRVPAWRERWRAGPVREVEATRDQLAAVAAGDPAHLADAAVEAAALADVEPRRLGCCGTLGVPLGGGPDGSTDVVVPR